MGNATLRFLLLLVLLNKNNTDGRAWRVIEIQERGHVDDLMNVRWYACLFVKDVLLTDVCYNVALVMIFSKGAKSTTSRRAIDEKCKFRVVAPRLSLKSRIQHPCSGTHILVCAYTCTAHENPFEGIRIIPYLDVSFEYHPTVQNIINHDARNGMTYRFFIK